MQAYQPRKRFFFLVTSACYRIFACRLYKGEPLQSKPPLFGFLCFYQRALAAEKRFAQQLAAKQTGTTSR